MNIVKISKQIEVTAAILEDSSVRVSGEINQTPMILIESKGFYEQGKDSFKKWLAEAERSLPFLAPFDRGRFYLTEMDHNKGSDGSGFWSTSEREGHKSIKLFFRPIGVLSAAWSMELWRERGRHQMDCQLYGDQRTKRFLTKYQVKAVAVEVSRQFAIACNLFQSPHMFPVRIRERKQGKSIQWHQAREYYSVIPRAHPANDQGIQQGAQVRLSQDAIKRCAHQVRAHTRLLVHPRWGKSVGKRVPVKASWRGPREWSVGKQIYSLTRR